MAEKATHADAQLILQLYDLRREDEMRKARAWFVQFDPRSADEYIKVALAFGTPENAWLRQVSGYWGIVASFVVNGVLNDDLFLAPGFSGEIFLLFAKIQPFIGEIRQKWNDPNAWKDIENAITRTEWGRNRLDFMMKRIEATRQRMAKQ